MIWSRILPKCGDIYKLLNLTVCILFAWFFFCVYVLFTINTHQLSGLTHVFINTVKIKYVYMKADNTGVRFALHPKIHIPSVQLTFDIMLCFVLCVHFVRRDDNDWTGIVMLHEPISPHICEYAEWLRNAARTNVRTR